MKKSQAKELAKKLADILVREAAAALYTDLSANAERMKAGGETTFTIRVEGMHSHEKVDTKVCDATVQMKLEADVVQDW